MEEASALASKVGILAKQMLGASRRLWQYLLKFGIAIGTTALAARQTMYEVYFSCPTREVIKAPTADGHN